MRIKSCAVVRPSGVSALQRNVGGRRGFGGGSLSKAQVKRLRTEKARVVTKSGKFIVLRFKSDRAPWYIERRHLKFLYCKPETWD